MQYTSKRFHKFTTVLKNIFYQYNLSKLKQLNCFSKLHDFIQNNCIKNVHFRQDMR